MVTKAIHVMIKKKQGKVKQDWLNRLVGKYSVKVDNKITNFTKKIDIHATSCLCLLITKRNNSIMYCVVSRIDLVSFSLHKETA